jgi:hypothetical protein
MKSVCSVLLLHIASFIATEAFISSAHTYNTRRPAPAVCLHKTHRARSRVLHVTVVDKELDEAFVESMNDVCTKV